ncbi:NAD-dependent epimerase/dehydratase family protein [Paucisalibacillus sp. EB02]|uniref:NAD-dependent epimerase/dehydratase family protein n=1 Tax=Paucisalibacillus sp. EB02 TaxID=1347087 RepID=UPI0004B9B349|nr:NAD-dependent epimerase/dehydratase family protein [Paucisalibacillus sp. EB02]
MKSRPKLLITGAAGFTGRHACQYFEKSGYEVIGVVRSLADDLDIGSTIPCNLVKKEEVDDVVKQLKPDYVLHLAAKNHVGTSWKEPIQTVETNALSTLYLVEAIRHANPDCKMITVGSVLQYNPQDIDTLTHPYSLSKTLQSIIAQAWESLYKVNIIIAKPSNLIGPGISNGICSILAKKVAGMEQMKEESIIEVSNLNARRDYLDVRDAVRGYDFLFRFGKSGEEYEIASGVTLSLEDVIQFLSQLSKVEFTVRAQSNKASDVFKGNPEKISQLGWSPQISFNQSLSDILNFYRKLS